MKEALSGQQKQLLRSRITVSPAILIEHLFTVALDFIIIGFLVIILLMLIAFDIHGLVPLAVIRLMLGVFFVLFAPGYALHISLFPGAKDLDSQERLVWSFGLSIALIPIIALVLDRLPWGIDLWSIVISLAITSLIFSLTAIFHRLKIPPQERYLPLIRLNAAGWLHAQNRSTHALYSLLTLGLIVLLLSVFTVFILYKPEERFTEFYLLGPDGQAENFPREISTGLDMQVTMGITNREAGNHIYWGEIWVEDSQEAGRREKVASFGPYPLERGQNLEEIISWRMPWAGPDQKIEFLLWFDDHPEPYRRLQLFTDIKE